MNDEPDKRTSLGRDGVLVSHSDGVAEYDVAGMSLRIHTADPKELDNDVLLIRPGAGTAHRLIRHKSEHNTLLVTEQCDQKCIMCSQPPKLGHFDLYDSFSEAVALAPEGATIGISGGEPTLHKHRLFGLLTRAKRERPDLRFHVLTNAQHFTDEDIAIIENLGSESVLWGIPIYAAQEALHDKIVEKRGAFSILRDNFSRLARAGARIELRTVVLQSNAEALEDLAQFVTQCLGFVDVWAIMQLENIGYGRMNWSKEFFDSSLDFEPVARAMDIAIGRALPVLLYNFPSCTVPQSYRDYCAASISDWKRKYVSKCEGCLLKSQCSGFFEWSPKDGGFSRLERQ